MRNKSAGPLILTPGEPGGVGTEITLKAWAQLCKYEEMRFALIADADHVRSISKQCGWTSQNHGISLELMNPVEQRTSCLLLC